MYCEDRNRTADRINNCSDRPQFIEKMWSDEEDCETSADQREAVLHSQLKLQAALSAININTKTETESRGISEVSRQYGNTLVFFGRIPRQISEVQLEKLAEPYGRIQNVLIIEKKAKDAMDSIGFVNFCNAEDANRAVNALHQTLFHGTKLVVDFARRTLDGLQLEKTFQKQRKATSHRRSSCSDLDEENAWALEQTYVELLSSAPPDHAFPSLSSFLELISKENDGLHAPFRETSHDLGVDLDTLDRLYLESLRDDADSTNNHTSTLLS